VLADSISPARLDLLTVQPDGQACGFTETWGNFYFQGKHYGIRACRQCGQVSNKVAVEDWNDEDLPGVFSRQRTGKPPVFFAKQRGGSFVETNLAVPTAGGQPSSPPGHE